MAPACFQPVCAPPDLYPAYRPCPSYTTSLVSVGQRGVGDRPHQLWTPARPRHRPTVVMRLGGDGDDLSAGDDAPETLFMRELRKRGLSPSSDKVAGSSGVASLETKTRGKDDDKGKGGGGSGSVGWDDDSSAETSAAAPSTDQRKLSMALNSEGIDGLIPRAWELLKLGSSFFILFWPLVLATVATFAAAYIYLGASFIHGGSGSGSGSGSGAPPYVEPYQLLGQEVVSCDLGPSSVSLHVG